MDSARFPSSVKRTPRTPKPDVFLRKSGEVVNSSAPDTGMVSRSICLVPEVLVTICGCRIVMVCLNRSLR